MFENWSEFPVYFLVFWLSYSRFFISIQFSHLIVYVSVGVFLEPNCDFALRALSFDYISLLNASSNLAIGSDFSPFYAFIVSSSHTVVW